jgi:hypothetical protein
MSTSICGKVKVYQDAGDTALKVDGTGTTQPVTNSNLDVALSTRLKPADTLTKVATVDTITNAVTVQQSTAANLKVDPSGVTSPVSIAASVTVVQATAANLKVDGSSVTQPVSNANLDATISSRLKPADTLTKVSTVDTITNAVTVQQSTAANLKVDLSGTAANSTAIKVLESKDTGRTYITLTLDAIAGVTSEALATMAINKAETTSSATSYSVTAGKTLRIQSMSATVRATSTTAITAGRIRLRTAASSIAANSPILVSMDLTPPTAAALAGASANQSLCFPDGLEIAATHQVGISHIISSTSSAVTVTVVGYEY